MKGSRLSLILFTVSLAIVAAGLTFYLVGSSPGAGGCSKHGLNHRVVIRDDKVLPEHFTAPKCDSLTIINLDNNERLIAFGQHEDHVPYDGVAERLLKHGESFTVDLVQTGNFRYHDHDHAEVQGTFTVTDK